MRIHRRESLSVPTSSNNNNNINNINIFISKINNNFYNININN